MNTPDETIKFFEKCRDHYINVAKYYESKEPVPWSEFMAQYCVITQLMEQMVNELKLLAKDYRKRNIGRCDSCGVEVHKDKAINMIVRDIKKPWGEKSVFSCTKECGDLFKYKE